MLRRHWCSAMTVRPFSYLRGSRYSSGYLDKTHLLLDSKHEAVSTKNWKTQLAASLALFQFQPGLKTISDLPTCCDKRRKRSAKQSLCRNISCRETSVSMANSSASPITT